MVAQGDSNDANESGALRVLVVDDNRDGADSLALLLSAWGYEARVAYDGLTVLEVARTFHPDVALLDLGLPGIDGYQLALRLRREPELSQIKLIAITGHEWKNARRRSREYGFDEHLMKPVEPERLRDLLASLAVHQDT